jgi:hypothetical protein
VATAISARILTPLSTSSPDLTGLNEQELLELATRRKRIQDGYESGLYTPLEAAEKLAALKRREETLKEKVRTTDQTIHAWDEWQKLTETYPDIYAHFPDWIRSESPARVNRLLASIIETIKIHHDLTVEVVWRK